MLDKDGTMPAWLGWRHVGLSFCKVNKTLRVRARLVGLALSKAAMMDDVSGAISDTGVRTASGEPGDFKVLTDFGAPFNG